MADIDFTQFGANLIDAARDRFKDFLAENRDVDDLVIGIGKSFAIRTAQYHLASTEVERATALHAIRDIRNTMELTLDGMAHLAKSEIFGQLKAALGMVLDLAIRNLPTIISLIRR